MLKYCVGLSLVCPCSGVQYSCEKRYQAVEVPCRFTGEFLERLGIPAVCPRVRVQGEHGVMLGGIRALRGKSEAQLSPSAIKSFHVEFT